MSVNNCRGLENVKFLGCVNDAMSFMWYSNLILCLLSIVGLILLFVLSKTFHIQWMALGVILVWSISSELSAIVQEPLNWNVRFFTPTPRITLTPVVEQ